MNLKSTVWDLAGVAAAALFTAVAQADTFYWMNKDGGEWSEPSNWRIGSSTGEVATCKPGLGDTATIRSDQLKTSYTIHLSEDVDVARSSISPIRRRQARLSRSILTVMLFMLPARLMLVATLWFPPSSISRMASSVAIPGIRAGIRQAGSMSTESPVQRLKPAG